jgi:hypothetical protein
MNAHCTKGSSGDLDKILHFRAKKTQAAQLRVLTQTQSVEAAHRAVQVRQERIIHYSDQLAQHQAHTKGAGAQAIPRLAVYVSAFADELSEKLQREQCELLDDQEALHAHRTHLHALRAYWLQAQSRQDAIQTALDRSRKFQTQRCESQAEEELGEIKPQANQLQ